jgi:protein required for attachment to host cells
MRKKWILIADGERAKIIEKSADGLKNIGLTHHSAESNKDKGHHSPGRVTPSMAHAQHSFPPHDEWRMFEKHEFAKKMADIINHNNDHFDELLLIAPSKVLGDLRMGLNNRSIEKIVGEMHKDYIHSSISEIEHLF